MGIFSNMGRSLVVKMFDKFKKKKEQPKIYRQEQIITLINSNNDLYKKVGALCSMDFLSDFISLHKMINSHTFTIDGKVFASDGCGGYYIFLNDGSIGYVNLAENECGRVAETLIDLLELELNCAYSWHNYGRKNYIDKPDLLEKDIIPLEVEGREDFEGAYGDTMPQYDDLQRHIAEALQLHISNNIACDILPLFYKTSMREPLFTGKENASNYKLNNLVL